MKLLSQNSSYKSPNALPINLLGIFAWKKLLDFNPKLYEVFGEEIFRKIVRHELCHYHLYFEGKGYKHSDADFKELLRKVDGLRYAPSLAKKEQFYRYRCQKCGQEYHRKRRVNTKKYVCGRCHGKLSYVDIK